MLIGKKKIEKIQIMSNILIVYLTENGRLERKGDKKEKVWIVNKTLTKLSSKPIV